MTTDIIKNILNKTVTKSIIVTVTKVKSATSYVVKDASGRKFVVSSTVKRIAGDSVRTDGIIIIESAPKVNQSTVFMV